MRTVLLAPLLLAAPAALAQMSGHEHHHGGHHDAPDGAMTGALGPYAMTREASGTAWQPEAAPMAGMHSMAAGWNVMTHGYLDVVYDDQGGPRGDEKVFVPGMLMVMGTRDAGPGTLGLRAMVSPDPLMGKGGYPLLFQTGETADGQEHLVDRQHPHDLFMELAGTYSVPVGAGSVFFYGGLPGEPALGPSAFMHRASGMDIPEAPLTHHWLDSTHITFGVATLGATLGPWKLEASGFNGREPDQNRWNIETRSFDSAAGRITFNPSASWSLQASYGYLAEPEQLEPGEAVHRTTASVSHTAATGGAHWSTTLAAGLNRAHGHELPGYLLESTRRFANPVTVFGRLEYVRNEELIDSGPLAGQEFGVAKLTLGGSYEFAKAGPLAFSAGALGSVYRFDEALEAEYGSRPVSAMAFLRTSIR
jgi:hypothetical protein